MKLKIEVVNWKLIYSLLIKIAKRIKKSKFKPELIMGISRGGWIPARILSDLLDNPNLANIKIKYYIGIYKTLKEPVLTQNVSVSVNNKKILVVDDITDSGKSISIVYKELMKKAKEVKTVTLYYKPWSCIEPDYYAKKTDAWIVFPWEYYETLKIWGKKLLDKGKTFSEMEEELIKIGLEATFVKKFAKEIFEKTVND